MKVLLVDNRDGYRRILEATIRVEADIPIIEAGSVFADDIPKGLKALADVREGAIFFPNGTRAQDHSFTGCSLRRLKAEGRFRRIAAQIIGMDWNTRSEGVMLGLPLATAILDLHGSDNVELAKHVEAALVEEVSKEAGINPPCAYCRVVTDHANPIPWVSHRIFGPGRIPTEILAALG